MGINVERNLCFRDNIFWEHCWKIKSKYGFLYKFAVIKFFWIAKVILFSTQHLIINVYKTAKMFHFHYAAYKIIKSRSVILKCFDMQCNSMCYMGHPLSRHLYHLNHKLHGSKSFAPRNADCFLMKLKFKILLLFYYIF